MKRKQKKQTYRPQHIQQILKGQMKWVNIQHSTPEIMQQLKRDFGFHELDLEDCLASGHVSKVDSYPNYIFLVLFFPLYDKQKKEIIVTEIDFFIGRNYLITLHHNKIPILQDIFESCNTQDSLKRKLFSDDPSKLLCYVLEKLLLYTFPMLEHIHQDIRNLEKRIFSGYERTVVRDLLNLKRNIINFRKAMQFHKGIIRRLTIKTKHLFPIIEEQVYFDNLIEHTKDIWDTLEIQKENVDALHLTNESLISFRLNDIMKFLTIISVIMLPITLIAALFGMNARYLPIVQSRYDFWIILLIMISVAALMLLIFKRNKWL